MAEASSSIVIKANPKACYEVITDYESYPDFLKETKEVEVKKKSGNNADVYFKVEVIKSVEYTLKMVGKPGKSVTWTLIEGSFFKKNNGSWELEEQKDGSTKATYSVDIEVGGLFVPGAITKMLVGSSLPSMLESFKKRIESKHKGKK